MGYIPLANKMWRNRLFEMNVFQVMNGAFGSKGKDYKEGSNYKGGAPARRTGQSHPIAEIRSLLMYP